MDGWKAGRSFWGPAYFQRFLLLVLGRNNSSETHLLSAIRRGYDSILFKVIFYFYHGKSQLNHHVGNVFDFFQPPNKQIQVILGHLSRASLQLRIYIYIYMQPIVTTLIQDQPSRAHQKVKCDFR